VVGVVDEKGARITAYGNTERKHGKSVDGDTLLKSFHHKVFTGLVLADMVERGEVKLDDPIAKFLPSSVKVPTRNGAQIKLVDLATQTSGLSRLPDNMTSADENNLTPIIPCQMYEFLSAFKLKRDIGQKYEYSNYGMVCWACAGTKSGHNYEAMVEQRVCRPLA